MEIQFTNLTWPQIMQAGAVVMGGCSILVVLYYYIKLLSISNLVKRYEYMGSSEIKYFKFSTVVIAIGLSMLFNSFIAGLFDTTFTFIAGIFLSSIIGVIIGYSAFAYFDVYYPFVLEKKLMTLRFKPRVNPETKKRMRLLNEHEEDVHMTPEMLQNEKSFAYDYDIWIDEETGFKLIERYDGHLHALICDECNFRTLKEFREEIIKSPTMNEKGLLLKRFKCSNCGHLEAREVSIAQLKTGERSSEPHEMSNLN